MFEKTRRGALAVALAGALAPTPFARGAPAPSPEAIGARGAAVLPPPVEIEVQVVRLDEQPGLALLLGNVEAQRETCIDAASTQAFHTAALVPDGSMQIPLDPRTHARVDLLSVREDSVTLRARIVRGGESRLDTTFRIPQDESFTVVFGRSYLLPVSARW